MHHKAIELKTFSIVFILGEFFVGFSSLFVYKSLRKLKLKTFKAVQFEIAPVITTGTPVYAYSFKKSSFEMFSTLCISFKFEHISHDWIGLNITDAISGFTKAQLSLSKDNQFI